MEKLYLVVRSDLPPGQQAVQVCHAMTEFLVEHGELGREWHTSSNTLALLSVADESALFRLVDKVSRKGLRFSTFREPDLQDTLTAIAVEPAAKPVLRNLRLALSNQNQPAV